MVRITATSDFHGILPTIPECELLLICGDICPDGSPAFQAHWLDTDFRNWLDQIPAKHVIGIAGNHDIVFEQTSYLVPKNLKWLYLEDQATELFGLRIYGTPWQLPFWGAFNLDEDQLVQRYAKIPHDLDIFISHGPPYGIYDEVPHGQHFQHVGSKTLYSKVLEIKPKLFVYGHVHCSTGCCKIDQTLFANVSLVNDLLEIAHLPVLFSLDPDLTRS